MASAPRYKVYNPEGEYVAAFKHLEDAACLIALYGDGATIRHEHSKAATLWTEGKEAFPASESYDGVHDVCSKRIHERNVKAHAAQLARNEAYRKTNA